MRTIARTLRGGDLSVVGLGHYSSSGWECRHYVTSSVHKRGKVAPVHRLANASMILGSQSSDGKGGWFSLERSNAIWFKRCHVQSQSAPSAVQSGQLHQSSPVQGGMVNYTSAVQCGPVWSASTSRPHPRAARCACPRSPRTALDSLPGGRRPGCRCLALASYRAPRRRQTPGSGRQTRVTSWRRYP